MFIDNCEVGKIEKQSFVSCYENSPLILTEGSVELRTANESGIQSDENIKAASRLYDAKSRNALEKIYSQYLHIAEDYSLPILIMTSTRRATKENLERSQFKDKNIIFDYVAFLRELASQYECPAFIGGIMGCKGSAYTGEGALSIEEAAVFHEWQVNEFEKAKVDYIFEAIMPVTGEIIRLSKLIGERKIPYIVSLMIRRSGKIIDGHTIHEAITEIDNALGMHKPMCYMANCIHPDILRCALSEPFNNTPTVKERFKGLEANAACAEPEELDSAQKILTSNANELADSFELLNEVLTMKICGGCCGTNDTHISAIAQKFRSKKR